MYLTAKSISDLPAIKVDGVYRVLGCKFSTPESVTDFPVFGASMANAPLDPSQWQEMDLEFYKDTVKDQGMSSACVSFSTTSGMELCILQSGRKLVEFNPYFTYAWINGGRDAGSMISDALKSLMSHGICLKQDLPLKVLFQNNLTQESITNGGRFKLIQAYRCNTFEEICSAITLGFVVPLGIYVDQNFSKLDSEGVSGTPANSRSGGGHAIAGCGLKKSSRYGWLIKIFNSWGNSFGKNGYSYIHKGHFSIMQPDAFAIQSVTDDPLSNDPNNVPIVT